MRSTTTTRGFSTIELLVAMAIVAIVTSQALSLFASQQRNAIAQQDVLEVQEDSRLVAQLMTTDIRMAGFMVPKRLAVSSVDGGANGSDILCVSDASVIDPDELVDVSGRFDGTRLAATLNGNAGSVSLTVAEMDIDGNGSNDYAANAGIIISDGTDSHCARITSVAGGTVNFTPSTPGGFSVAGGMGRAVPAVVYEVTGNGLLRNKLRFAEQVEDLQIEFGVDLNGDGEITGAEFPIHVINGSEPGSVRTVRLTVVARTQREDLGLVGGQLPPVANRNAGAGDTFRRRLVTNVVAPRNLL